MQDAGIEKSQSIFGSDNKTNPAIMPSIDTQDPKYQVTDQFKPDKESTWKYPAERDGWRIAHNAIRGELAFMRETLQIIRGRALQQWEVQALKEAANAHLLHIRSHHKYVYRGPIQNYD
jgi:hypothetical protein